MGIVNLKRRGDFEVMGFEEWNDTGPRDSLFLLFGGDLKGEIS